MRGSAQKGPGKSPIIHRAGSTAIHVELILAGPLRLRLVSDRANCPDPPEAAAKFFIHIIEAL